MLQGADSELDAGIVFGAFRDLCLATEADIDLVETLALRDRFERFDFRVPVRRDVLKLKRRVAFRRPGLFLTAEHFVAQESKKPTAVLNVASLLAKPADFQAVRTLFVAEFGEPNQRDHAGFGLAFASVAGVEERPATYDEAHARHEAGEGDFIVINLNDVRTYAELPSDTISMSYSRWIR